ncbi:sigma 54-interacting transcriptional regulator [Pendulispora brunnea]|uniref:Sigma 54-interacting transcriptional regulator n=1 Tax=Pendulispora brunnea TaxID=2905690 RepID=A0ABZ2KMF9_9BACT
MRHAVPPGGEHTKVQTFEPRAKAAPCPHLMWRDLRGQHKVKLTMPSTLLGSASGVSVVITDTTVSRLHAEIELREDGVWIRDLGSRNGTFVEGVLVSRARVADGSKVKLGVTELTVVYDGEQQPPELWPEESFGPLVGRTPVMRALFAYLSNIAKADSPVFIQGETGTGKELVAQAIHEASPRADKPFVIVDCAALPENLIESELFGHAKGAFTGAITARTGAIEAADGGTVFLDEIGDLPMSVQPRLLRALESGTIRRVGETSRRKVNVRFLSATHRDLRTMVNAGDFREDLYFRLAVLPVSVPPLREHLDDVPLLVERFLPRGVVASPEIVAQLTKRPWLGNVRALRNFVHRAAVMGAQVALSLSDTAGEGVPVASASNSAQFPAFSPSPSLPPPAPGSLPGVADFDPAIFDADFKRFRESWGDTGEREYVRRLLARHARNVSNAARAAGVDRTYLYRLIRKHLL